VLEKILYDFLTLTIPSYHVEKKEILVKANLQLLLTHSTQPKNQKQPSRVSPTMPF
jgi:hypothetical protein